jgi:crotonobetaine/carnitine-CoA ligase
VITGLPGILLAGARTDPQRAFLCFEGRTHSRAEAADAVLRVAGWFARTGFAAGDRVAIMLHNEPEFLFAWFGAGLAGVMSAPIDPDLRGEELARRLAETQPRAVIVRPRALSAILAVRDRFPSLRLIVAGDAPEGTTPWSELIEGPPGNPRALLTDAPMEIVYTAGTTAPAHAVVWRHSMLTTAGIGLAQLLRLHAQDRLMVVLPLHGAYAQFSVAMAIAAGASILLEPGFSASRFWNNARKGGATQVSLSGALLSELQARPPRKADADHPVRRVLSLATPKDLHEAFENRFGVRLVEAYGLTEAGFVAINPVERGRRKVGTVGLPVSWCEVAVFDGKSRRATPGAIGEICVRLRDKDAAWIRTGDLGVIDEEGFLTFIDRHEDVVRRSGRTFPTRPIELALLRHPAVADAAVVPDARHEEVLALVVLRAPVGFDQLSEFCREWLDAHPAPTCFKAVEEIPRTPAGRIRKAELRAQPGLFDHVTRVA